MTTFEFSVIFLLAKQERIWNVGDHHINNEGSNEEKKTQEQQFLTWLLNKYRYK